MIRSAMPADAGAIAEIYNHYVLHSIATFEEDLVASEEMGRRIRSVGDRYPWLVCEEGAELLGYCYATAFRDRSAYRFTAESTVYLRPAARGKGIGTRLYRELLERLEVLDLHRVVAGIALPNDPSVRLHERLGFEASARFSEVGRKFERWIDVGWWVRELRQTSAGATPR